MNHTYYTIDPQQDFQGMSYSLWQPEGATNKNIQHDNGIHSNWKYR